VEPKPDVALASAEIEPARFEPKNLPAAAVCESHGTAVNFVKSPREAARRAGQQEKLVFVLHVSGNFEDAEFT
jgi:hypothetical protein